MPEQEQVYEPRWKRRFADNQEARRWNQTSLLLTLPLLAVGCYYYGLAVLRTAVIAAFAAVVCELIGGRLVLRQRVGDDWNAVVIGVWMACLLPARMEPRNTVALYAVVGAVFAVLFVKLPFGGTMNAPFSPAAAGFCFLSVCFPAKVYAFQPSVLVPPAHSRSLAAMLAQGRSVLDGGHFIDVLLGRVMGPACACALVTLAILLAMLLIKERRSSVLVSLGFLVGVALIAFVFPRVVSAGTPLMTRLSAVGMELFAGNLLFAAVLMLPDPAIMPRRWFTRFGFGAMAGLFAMLLRLLGHYEDGVCFAVMLADAFMPLTYRLQAEIKSQKEFRSTLNV
ncbi:MAG: RnfABCDGE type electron transport complex subunit D [Oscillospiraceae bacterium]|jgi:electron transport complex protein RnfD|nr:RnfABCDGE type electron transport complex subunit D [Oscillospiraceae bacterium]